jgi:hypothetical protein
MCAVGRCLKSPRSDLDTSVEAGWLNSEELDADLKEEYRGHGREFWRYLQMLHDLNGNWDDNGLSALGLIALGHLKDRYEP